jgi:hypothetical protein
MENLSLNRRATESRSFIVTLAVLNAKTDSFQTSSFLQPCDAGDYSRVKEPYLGVHSIEAKDADEMKTFIQCSVPGSDKMKLIIFHAGLLPNTGTLSSALNSKLSFFAKSKGYSMTYYTTSTSYSARLAVIVTIIIRGAKTNLSVSTTALTASLPRPPRGRRSATSLGVVLLCVPQHEAGLLGTPPPGENDHNNLKTAESGPRKSSSAFSPRCRVRVMGPGGEPDRVCFCSSQVLELTWFGRTTRVKHPRQPISLSFSTQLQYHQTTTNIAAIYIIVSASASSI